MSFFLEVITPEKKIFTGKVKKLIIPSSTGQLTILTRHLPLFTPLKEGTIKIVDLNNKARSITISKGMIEIRQDKVSLLVEPPEHADKIAKQKAKEAAQKAKKVDKTKIIAKGTVSTPAAFRRSFIDISEIKRKRKIRSLPTAEVHGK